MAKHIDMKQPILDKNDAIARELRQRFADAGVYVLDLLASPGSGKTSTILATIDALRDEFNIAVIEGDIASSVDAEKIKAQGTAAVQINTGGACHLESAMIKRAVDVLDLDRLDLIIIENVGNLVCPTDFDLGENAKAMILSVPEGHDKPLKYPGVFQVSDAVILNKADTMPVFDFEEGEFTASVRQLNPQAPLFKISATKGDGVDAWAEWLTAQIREAQKASPLMRALDMAFAWDSICQQTRAFLESVGCTEVVIGLSGGLDSSVVAVVACEVLGPARVHGVLMPGPYSSQGSIDDALDLAQRLGVAAETVPITGAFQAFSKEYEDSLRCPLTGLAAENTQARLRMCVLMALSNERGWLVLNTGNLSEAAMGYSTLYGDTAGAFAPLGGLYKTEVFQLARHLNAVAEAQGETPPIPESVITKPPSAELSEGQSDEASLGMSYAEMDEVLSCMLDEGIPAQEISPFAEEVWKRYQANAFKRALEPPFAVMQTQE